MAFEKGHPYYPSNPTSPGRQKIRKALSGLSDDLNKAAAGESISDQEMPWVVGGRPSAKGQKFLDDIEAQNAADMQMFATQTVISIPEPDYYKGPERSTRVIRHRFVPSRATGLTGTAYVQFGGTRKNGKRKTEDIYAYYNVPPSVYLDFCNTESKGQTIDAWTRNYPDYQKLNDPSVFTL
jgi:hypothetical protein